jgi:hypothetical protein
MNITIETLVKANLNTVWTAWNNPDDIKQWNAASDDWHTIRSAVDLREGGKFRRGWKQKTAAPDLTSREYIPALWFRNSLNIACKMAGKSKWNLPKAMAVFCCENRLMPKQKMIRKCNVKAGRLFWITSPNMWKLENNGSYHAKAARCWLEISRKVPM